MVFVMVLKVNTLSMMQFAVYMITNSSEFVRTVMMPVAVQCVAPL